MSHNDEGRNHIADQVSEGAPLEIDTVADYQKLAGVLSGRGYSREDIANILYGN